MLGSSGPWAPWFWNSPSSFPCLMSLMFLKATVQTQVSLSLGLTYCCLWPGLGRSGVSLLGRSQSEAWPSLLCPPMWGVHRFAAVLVVFPCNPGLGLCPQGSSSTGTGFLFISECSPIHISWNPLKLCKYFIPHQTFN